MNLYPFTLAFFHLYIKYLFKCINYNQFLFFKGIRGCYLFFIAILTDIGTGSTTAFIVYGPMILLGLNEFGLIILFIEFDFIGCYLILFVLFCL